MISGWKKRYSDILKEFKFLIIDRSLSTQSDLIFVKNGPWPVFTKNPIAGSNTIFSDGTGDFFAIF